LRRLISKLALSRWRFIGFEVNWSLREKRSKEFAMPLEWPVGWPRTEKPSQKMFPAVGHGNRRKLLNAIRQQLRGYQETISENQSNGGQPADTGVAVRFRRQEKQMVIACDEWDRVADNIVAIIETIDALESIKRKGGENLWRRALTAFEVKP
jgi:hypothetical protein